MKYLVSHQGHELEPLSLDEIVFKVKAKEIELFDYIFDDGKQDWVLLMEHAELSAKLKSNKPPRPPSKALPEAPVAQVATKLHVVGENETEWFILKGENKFGPFSYNDVVKMLQQKVVFSFDFVWQGEMDQWKRVAELPEFSPDTIRDLFASGVTQPKAVFTTRQHKRQKFSGRVLLHDNLSLWRAEGLEISKGGVGILMKNSLVVPGQQLFVHFHSDGDLPAFNAVCEVVSKKFVNDNSPVEYGLRFMSMTQDVQAAFNKKVA